MKKLSLLLAILLVAPTVQAAPCYQNGETVTLSGKAVRQYMELGNSTKQGVWVLALNKPVCVIDDESSEGANGRLTVSRVQLIGQSPPEGVGLELQGRLSTGNYSQYYLVPTALWVKSGRKIEQ